MTGFIAPDTHADGDIRIVCKKEGFLSELLSSLSLDVFGLSDANDHTQKVYCLDLDHIFNVSNLLELKGNFGNGAVVDSLLDLGVSTKGDAEVVVVLSEPFVCKLHHSLAKGVNVVFFNLAVPLLSVIIEESGLNWGSVAVNEL